MDDFVNPRQSLEPRRVHTPVVADEADRSPLRARAGLRLIAHLLDDGDDLFDFLGRCSMPHNNEHYEPLPSPMVKRSPSFAAVIGPRKRVAANFAGSEFSTGG